MNDMSELLEQVSASYALQNSLVAFIPGLLAQYLRGEIDGPGLRTLYWNETRKAQFFFHRFPKAEIDSNRRLFKREFDFADAVANALNYTDLKDDATLKAALRACMEQYLRAAEQSED